MNYRICKDIFKTSIHSAEESRSSNFLYMLDMSKNPEAL